MLLLLGGIFNLTISWRVPSMKAFGINFIPVKTGIQGWMYTAHSHQSWYVGDFCHCYFDCGAGKFCVLPCFDRALPQFLKRPLGVAIELLAVSLSIIYGMWGFFVFVPWFSEHIQPWLIDHLGCAFTWVVYSKVRRWVLVCSPQV